jgi:hypothetical protein
MGVWRGISRNDREHLEPQPVPQHLAERPDLAADVARGRREMEDADRT